MNETQNNDNPNIQLTDLEPVGEVKGGFGDVNGDGRDDVIVASPPSGTTTTPRPRGITIVAH